MSGGREAFAGGQGGYATQRASEQVAESRGHL